MPNLNEKVSIMDGWTDVPTETVKKASLFEMYYSWLKI